MKARPPTLRMCARSRLAGRGLVVAALGCFLEGCRPDAENCGDLDFDSVDSVCDLSDDSGEFVVHPDGSVSLSEDCVEALGRAFCVDYPSFGEDPKDIRDPGSALELVFSGLVPLLGVHGSSVDESIRRETPSALADAFAGMDEGNHAVETRDVGRGMYEYLTGRVTKITYAPTIEAVAFFADGVITVGDISREYGDSVDTGSLRIGPSRPPREAVEMGLILVHEASHRVQIDSCDLKA